HHVRRAEERAVSGQLTERATDAQEFRLSREDDRGQACELEARASDGDSSTDFNLCGASANTRLRQLETSLASVFTKPSPRRVLQIGQSRMQRSILTGGPLHTHA